MNEDEKIDAALNAADRLWNTAIQRAAKAVEDAPVFERDARSRLPDGKVLQMLSICRAEVLKLLRAPGQQ